jgi:hypothetical protein
MQRHLKSAAWLAVYLLAMVVLWGMLAHKYNFVLILVISVVWIGLMGTGVLLSKQWVRYYEKSGSPEYLGAGSGTGVAVVIAVCALITWGAVELIRALIS